MLVVGSGVQTAAAKMRTEVSEKATTVASAYDYYVPVKHELTTKTSSNKDEKNAPKRLFSIYVQATRYCYGNNGKYKQKRELDILIPQDVLSDVVFSKHAQPRLQYISGAKVQFVRLPKPYYLDDHFATYLVTEKMLAPLAKADVVYLVLGEHRYTLPHFLPLEWCQVLQHFYVEKK